MAQDIVIAVASHKAYRMPEGDTYLPLQVGAALHPDLDLGWQRDDDGDNISMKNGSYSELTGLYWLWKNSDAPIKGLVHYRRLLGSPDRGKRRATDPFDRLADKAELESLLTGKDVVVARRRNYYIETIRSHYAHTLDGSQLDVTRGVIEMISSEYIPAFDHVMASRGAHLFNMFVMPSQHFDAYCSWLFPVIDGVVAQIGLIDDPFKARYPGRISEILLDVWLQTQELSCAELPVISPEPVDWPKKVTGFLAAKFAGKKYEKSF